MRPLFPEARDQKRDQCSGPSQHGERSERVRLRLCTHGFYRMHFYPAEFENARHGVWLRAGAEPGDNFVFIAHVDRNPRGAKGRVELICALFANRRRPGTRRQKAPRGPDGRDVNYKNVAVTTDVDILAVDGKS